MVGSCCVIDCATRDKKGQTIKFCRFPTAQPRRRLWLSALKRKNFNPDKHFRVCGIHFNNGQPSYDWTDPDYVPHLKMGYESTANERERMARYVRATVRAYQRAMNCQDTNDVEDEDTLSVDSEMEEVQPDTDSSIDDTDELQQDVKKLEDANLMLVMDNQNLKNENILLKSKIQELTFGENFISQKNFDYRTKFYTGLPNYHTFIWILSFLSAVLPNSTMLSSGDVLLMVLMKMKLNLKFQDIAFRFNVSKTTVSNLINKSLPVMAESLKFLVRWPEKAEIQRNLPSAFKHSLRFRKCRVILDCTEIFIERSRNLNLQALTWSQYKHHNTIKLLVGISPTGAITFVSQAFGGRVSDKVQTQKSGLLDLLEPGDLVLADRGFLIEEDLAAVGASLAIPAFTKGKKQLSMRDVETTRQLARVRIHVERAMERIKNFNILSTVLPISLLIHSDNIIMICSALSNLQPKLVK